jgi:CRP-like cAMP-binding protein
VAFIPQDDVLRFLAGWPSTSVAIGQSAYEPNRSIGLSHLVRVTERPAARLLVQWSMDGRATNRMIRTKPAVTHEEIVQWIGSTREAITRTFSDLKKRAIAELTGSTLLIPNPAALKSLAAN